MRLSMAAHTRPVSAGIGKLVFLIAISCAALSPVAVAAQEAFDKFGETCCEDEMARLDNFAIQLQQEPGAKGYIVFYGGRRHNFPYCYGKRRSLPRRGEAEARAARMKPYLVDRRGIASERIVVINGGYRETWSVELWILPKDAAAPTPTPTLRPRDIKFRRGRARARDYNCNI